MRIHQQQEIFVANELTALVHLINGRSRKGNAEASCEVLVPLFIRHFSTIRAEPNDILNLRSFYFSALEEFATPEHRVLLVQRDQLPNESERITVHALRSPIDPADFVVLAIGIVVPALSTPDLVSCEQHGDALRKQDCCHEVPLLPCPKLIHLGIIGRAFSAAIPAPVVVGAVAILLAVSFVMLGVVAHEIVKGEPVMRGHKIDAGVRLAAAARVQVARASDAVREFADQAAVALPIRANNVTILVIPFRPANRKFADLISAFAKIPGFGDELYLRENWVLMNDVEKCAQAIDFVQLACEGSCQIEARTSP